MDRDKIEKDGLLRAPTIDEVRETAESLQKLSEACRDAPGSAVNTRKLEMTRPDDTERLVQPLDKYGDRVMFFPGLVHAFCGIDATLTFRYRQETGEELPAWVHPLENPVVEVASAPRFTQAKLSRTLQSTQVERFDLFKQFMEEQRIVDRKRKTVFALTMHQIQVMDPYSVDTKQLPPLVPLWFILPRTAHMYIQVAREPGASSLAKACWTRQLSAELEAFQRQVFL